MSIRSRFVFVWCFLVCGSTRLFAVESSDGLPEVVSYHQHVRPVFQAKCQGCHQPAKRKGDYVMTDVAALIAGGESGAAIVPGQTAASYLLELVVTQQGEERPEMPPKDAPLTDYEVSLVNRWIEQGATDDTPENVLDQYSRENPPEYTVPPLITSIDFSPDGQHIAVSGFHEVLIHKADGSGLEQRLIGLSERIETVAFSPDGSQLLVAGGSPGRLGEIQIWDVADGELKLSAPVGYDTAYGGSWSPDGTRVAFGMPDNTARAIQARNGEQVFFMGGHNDWVLDTTWSQEGTHLVSVGRDMTAKLSEVATERFVDNITSITPGALSGGMNAVDRHPHEDHILVGGSDGVPQIYRMIRETARKIGDNANLIRKYPALRGRIWDVAFAPDGKTFAAVSSLDGRGQLAIYRSDYDATITPELKKLFETARRRNDDSVPPEIEAFHTEGAERLHLVDFPHAVYSVAFSPDGAKIGVGGADGLLRIFGSADGSEAFAFTPVEVNGAITVANADPTAVDHRKAEAHPPVESAPNLSAIEGIEISALSFDLTGPRDYRQLLAIGHQENGDEIDLTRDVDWRVTPAIASIDHRGELRPLADGEAKLSAHYDGKSVTLTLTVSATAESRTLDFVQDVNPVITRLGCNMGTCHGAKDGKNGFKLSLRGYDPLYDVRGFADDHAARRINFASPDDSLMLLKATGAVPHEAGPVTELDSRFYHTIRQWIADGASVSTETAKVASIELYPKNPVVQRVGNRQQFRVVARFSDGQTRDVTREAFIDSGNTEVADHDDFGLLDTLRRGEAPILARYEGRYAATTLTVMGDRDGFTWEEPQSWSQIDRLVAAKWERMKIAPSDLASDAEFIRRIYLDLTGLPPTSTAVRTFLADDRPIREKRDALIDELIGSPEFVDHWTNKWSDLLQVNSKFLGGDGSRIFRDWIKQQVAENRPYDEFVYEILTATGSNKANPAASYYKILREPDALVENTTHLFLATRFNCNKCHDHPFERWTQDQYYETAAYFAQIDRTRDTENAPKQNIGGTAVEGAKPLYEVIDDRAEGELNHQRTGEIQPPAFPYPADLAPVAFSEPEAPTRREKLAAWITSADNDYFAYSYANRVWGYLLGTGVIEPLDDIRAGNPPTNPELLQHLTAQFIASGFDVQKLIADICKSRTYQLSIASNRWNEDDTINFSHAKARRLPAEVLYDAVHLVAGTQPDIPGAGRGVRASQLPDVKLDLKSGFLANLGRPARESSCECERTSELQMSAVMAFLSGPAIADAIGAEDNELASLVRRLPDDRKLIEELYLRALSRLPGDAEVEAAIEAMTAIETDHGVLVDQVKKAEADWVGQRSDLEIARHQRISTAEEAIVEYGPDHLARQKKAEADRTAAIKAATASVEAREAALPGVITEFAETRTAADLWTRWHLLPVKTATGSDKAEVETLPDGSVRTTGGSRKRNLDYLITGSTSATDITAIMIEAVPDERNPAYGAGVNANGNFVITEIQTRWNPAADPKANTPLKIGTGMASFTQNGFSLEATFDGKVDRGNKGWALAGANPRMPHRAILKFAEPMVGNADGADLVVGVLCRYSGGDYPIGRFRVWYTTAEDPLRFGLPDQVAAAIAAAPSERTEAEADALATYVAENDEPLRNARYELLKAERPISADPKQVALEAALKKAEIAILPPRRLIQLRQDLDHSIEQAANRRLTAAQDLVWALVNSPSFLFNR